MSETPLTHRGGGGAAGVDFGPTYQLRAVRAGRAYRAIVVWLGLAYLLAILGGVVLATLSAGDQPPESGGAVLVGLLLAARGLLQLVAEIAMLVNTWRLAQEMNRSPVLWLLAMFLPVINLIGLVRLSGLATEFMGHVKVRVGLLGPSRDDLDELERRALMSRAPSSV